MKLLKAIEYLEYNYRIKKKNWSNLEYLYRCRKTDSIYKYKTNPLDPFGKDYELYTFTVNELCSSIDWEIIYDHKTVKFETALEAYRRGAKIFTIDDSTPYPTKFMKGVLSGGAIDVLNCRVMDMEDDRLDSRWFSGDRILNSKWIIEEK